MKNLSAYFFTFVGGNVYSFIVYKSIDKMFITCKNAHKTTILS